MYRVIFRLSLCQCRNVCPHWVKVNFSVRENGFQIASRRSLKVNLFITLLLLLFFKQEVIRVLKSQFSVDSLHKQLIIYDLDALPDKNSSIASQYLIFILAIIFVERNSCRGFPLYSNFLSFGKYGIPATGEVVGWLRIKEHRKIQGLGGTKLASPEVLTLRGSNNLRPLNLAVSESPAFDASKLRTTRQLTLLINILPALQFIKRSLFFPLMNSSILSILRCISIFFLQ